jgi:MFS family permease
MQKIYTYRTILTIGISFNFARMLIGGFSTLYLLNKGLTYSDVGLLKSFQALIILFSDIPLGYISDKLNRKYTLILATLFGSLWLFTTAIADNLSLFYLAEAFNALSLALFNGSFIAFLVEEYKSNNKTPKHIISLYQSNTFFFMALGAALGGTFFTLDSNIAWFTAGTICLLLSITSMLVLPEKSKVVKKSHSSFMKDLILTIKKDIKIYVVLFKKHQIMLIYIIFLYLSISFVYQCIIQYWQVLFKSATNFSESLTLAVSYTFVCVLLLQSFASFIAKKLNFLKLLVISGISLFINNLIFLYALNTKNSIISILAIFIMFFALRLITTTIESLFHHLLYNKIRATFDSALSTLNRLFLIVLLPVLGVSMVNFGEQAILYMFLIVSIISLFIIITIRMNYSKFTEKMKNF